MASPQNGRTSARNSALVRYDEAHYSRSALGQQRRPLIEIKLDQKMCGVLNEVVYGHCGTSVDIVVAGSKGQT